MPDLLALLRRLRGSVRTAAFERAMAEELQAHLEFEADALVARGMPPEAARAEARRRFGSIAATADGCRDSWGLRTVESLVQDARYAIRILVGRHRSHTAVVVLTLAIGIGATTAIFSVVHAVLIRSLPYANGESLVELRQRADGMGIENINLSAPELADYRRESASLDAIVEYHRMSFTLLDAPSGGASRVLTGVVSADFFDVIGVKPLLGRSFRPDDDLGDVGHDAPAVLIVSYPFWRDVLGSDPAIVGRTFEMNDRPHTVVGVLPPMPQYPDGNDVYMPVSACPFRSAPHMETARGMRMVSAIGRVKPGTPLETARRDVAAIAARMAAAHPGDYEPAARFAADLVPVRDELTRRARPTLLVLLAAAGFVLALVCANVANLTLAKLRQRDRELALRVALGAGRGRIARQLLTEALLLATAGGALGLACAAFARDLLVSFALRLTPRAAEINIDRTALLFALAISAATGLLFGVGPALRACRPQFRAQRAAARQALVAAQVAIAFVLLVGAGLTVRSFVNLLNVDAGFTADRVLTARIDVDWVKYPTSDARRALFRPLLARIQALPAVTSAALGITFPLNPTEPSMVGFVTEPAARGLGQPPPVSDFNVVTPDYFRTLGIQFLAGRPFTAADAAGAPAVAIVNLSMAQHRFDGANAIGRRISFDDGRSWASIVGVVHDVKQYGLDAAPVDEVYVPFDQRGPLAATIVVRAAGDPADLQRDVAAAVRAVEPRQPVSSERTLQEIKSRSLAAPRVTMQLVSLFAALALVVTAAGIAGVVAFGVSQRTTEIGIRMALGASRAAVIRLIAAQGLRPVVAGLLLGAAASVTLARVVVPAAASLTGIAERPLLFAVGPTDAPTYAAVAAMLAAAAAVACVLPARRAVSVDPTRALRAD